MPKQKWQLKMTLTIIAAVSRNNVIGANGKIPWNIPEDMKRFKDLTLNHSVIMGRKTFENILNKFGKPLPKRKNIVLSTTLRAQERIYIARTIDEALVLTEGRDSFVIGGAQIYELFLPKVDKLEITRVEEYFEGDAFFPEVNWNEWRMIDSESRDNPLEIKLPFYSFLTYIRK
jgi:dihydrofolate reductase